MKNKERKTKKIKRNKKQKENKFSVHITVAKATVMAALDKKDLYKAILGEPIKGKLSFKL
jgi:hypothetical protein